MRISDIMTRNVRVVSPDKSIQEAARLMALAEASDLLVLAHVDDRAIDLLMAQTPSRGQKLHLMSQ